MRPMNGFVAIALALALTSGALACEKEGPMERAGEQVDEAVDEAKDKVD